jgi:hypothetical protein
MGRGVSTWHWWSPGVDHEVPGLACEALTRFVGRTERRGLGARWRDKSWRRVDVKLYSPYIDHVSGRDVRVTTALGYSIIRDSEVLIAGRARARNGDWAVRRSPTAP